MFVKQFGQSEWNIGENFRGQNHLVPCEWSYRSTEVSDSSGPTPTSQEVSAENLPGPSRMMLSFWPKIPGLCAEMCVAETLHTAHDGHTRPKEVGVG
jgi:hypothetical protein